MRGSTSLQKTVSQTTSKTRAYDHAWCEIIDSHKKRGVVIDNEISSIATDRPAEHPSYRHVGKSSSASYWFGENTGGCASRSSLVRCASSNITVAPHRVRVQKPTENVLSISPRIVSGNASNLPPQMCRGDLDYRDGSSSGEKTKTRRRRVSDKNSF